MIYKFIVIVLILTNTTLAYPNNELPAIFKEKYPNASIGTDIRFQNDGNGVYLRYSIYPDISELDREIFWQKVQDKRASALQNQTIANRIKQNYTQAMDDLKTIQNGNPPFTQAGFNQVVWAQKRDSEILMDILRFMKWYYWDNT